MKFYIDMLDTAARRDLIENNYALGNMVYDDMIESEMYFISEQLEYIKPGLKDWSIGPANHNYIKVKDALLFLDGLEELQKNYCTLSDDMQPEIDRVLAARDRFRTIDMGYYNLYQLSEWLDRKAQFFADWIADYFTRCLDFDRASMIDYFLEFYAEERMDHTFYIENGKLYQSIIRELK